MWVKMPDKVSDREECNTWAFVLEVFAKSLEKISDPSHTITDDERKELPDILHHLGTALAAARDKCAILIP